MLISKDGNTTIITQEKLSVIELVRKLTNEYNRYKFDNLIINLTSLNKLNLEDVIEFLQISNEHRGSKHSFVIVSDAIDVDDIPDEIIVVPTMQEAFDLIEMEEMERDLGI